MRKYQKHFDSPFHDPFNNYYQNMFSLHEGTTAGSNHVEHREGVDDKTELLVGQKGVQQNEAYSYAEWYSCSSVQ